MKQIGSPFRNAALMLHRRPGTYIAILAGHCYIARMRSVFRIKTPRPLRPALNKIIALVFCAFTLAVTHVGTANAENDIQQFGDPRKGIHYTERDYISRRNREFHGTTAVKGQVYLMSTVRATYPEIVTFTMTNQSDLFVSISPLDSPAGVLMLGSNPTSLRDMKPAWYNNDIRHPVEFWISDFWKSRGTCNNNNNCSKISFRAIQGSAEITIREIKWRTKPIQNFGTGF